MKRIMCLILSLIMFASFMGISPGLSAAAAEEEKSLSLVLPNGRQEFGDGLLELAKREGINLNVEYIPQGISYLSQLSQLLEGEEPPDMFLLFETEDSKSLIYEGAAAAFNSENSAGIIARSLAEMLPDNAVFMRMNTVYGLPLGYYGEGYIVNISLLASLLNSSDINTLEKDLTNCSYEEWEKMVKTIHSYLSQPQKKNIVLNGRTYVMPRYRKEETKALRAVFSFPSAEDSPYADLFLAKALSSIFSSPEELMELDSVKKRVALEQVLPGYFSALGLETSSMERGGSMDARGEGFNERESVRYSDAKNAFISGKTLFMGGNTKEIYEINKDNPDLLYDLRIIPVKMPYKTEKKSLDNKLLCFWTEGYLFVNSKSENKASAFRLLESLFVSSEGRQLIKDKTNLIPYNTIYSNEPIEKKLISQINSGKIKKVPAEKAALDKTVAELGKYIRENMMEISDWDDDVYKNFSKAALMAFGAEVPNEETEEDKDE